MKNRINHSLVMLGIVALMAGVALFAWYRFGLLSPTLASAESLGSGIGDSSQQVSASVIMRGPSVDVTLHIRPGWHVNANPASLKYLIPTTVSIERGESSYAARANYPPGKNSGLIIDGKNIQVYDDDTIIPLSGLASLAGVHIVVHAQACSTKGVCLPPANVVATTGGYP